MPAARLCDGCTGALIDVHVCLLLRTESESAYVYTSLELDARTHTAGVFVENSFKNAQPDRHTMALEQRRAHIKEANELHEILKSVDTDGTGNISEDEFIHLSKDSSAPSSARLAGEKQKQLASFELAVFSLESRWRVLASLVGMSRGQRTGVSVERFIMGHTLWAHTDT